MFIPGVLESSQYVNLHIYITCELVPIFSEADSMCLSLDARLAWSWIYRLKEMILSQRRWLADPTVNICVENLPDLWQPQHKAFRFLPRDK